ncbi:MAG TPA: hypothetical protein VFF04_01040 [Candidatus Babeliales bacterium]|nr:hypothetical protein [Candidatus Babeliales bacterium]
MRNILLFLVLFTSSSSTFATDTIDQANQKEKKQSHLTRLVKVAVPVCTALAALTTYAYIKHQKIPDLNSVSVVVQPGLTMNFNISASTDCGTIIEQIKQKVYFRPNCAPGLEICYKTNFLSLNTAKRYVFSSDNMQETIKYYRSNVFQLFVAI